MKTERSLLVSLLLSTLPLTVIAITALAGGGSRASAPQSPAPPSPAADAATSPTQGPRPLPAAENGVGRLVANVDVTDLSGKKQKLVGA
ncbi:MAG: hypothetical protein V4671_02125, partial [Armatimonadota bacterium]